MEKFILLLFCSCLVACGEDVEIKPPSTNTNTDQVNNTTGKTNNSTPSLCGNGTIDLSEDCDENDVGGQTCANVGLLEGNVVCSSKCVFDFSGCGQLLVPGQECIVGNGQCNSEGTCIKGSADRCTGLCLAISKESSPCGRNALCESGLFCKDEVCKKNVTIGASCDSLDFRPCVRGGLL